MGKSKHPRQSAGQTDKSSIKNSRKIISQPSEVDLLPTEREKRLLEDLFDWQERSRKTHWILGEPLGVRT